MDALKRYAADRKSLDHWQEFTKSIKQCMDRLKMNQGLSNDLLGFIDSVELTGQKSHSITGQKSANRERHSLVIGTIMDIFLTTVLYCEQQILTEDKADCCIIVVSCYVSTIMNTDLSQNLVIDTVSDCLLSFTVDKPPVCRLILIANDIRDYADFIVWQLFSRYSSHLLVLRAKKELDLRIFRPFAKTMPHNLPLSYARSVSDPLSIDFLRKYLLPPGTVYFSDTQIMKMTDVEYEKLNDEEKKVVDRKRDKLKKTAAITKVLDNRLGALKSDMEHKLDEISKQVTD